MADVLVIGAGPTGLMMAAELARLGLSCRLIDRGSGPSPYSKALAVQARTLEIFAHLGIVEEFLDLGLKVRALNPVSRGKRLARIDFSGLDSSFPFVLSLEQSKTEEILLGYAGAGGVRAERNLELIQIEESGGRVEAVLKDANGVVTRSAYSWAVGCDGAHSAVRKLLGFSFEGKAFSDVFSLADVAIDNLPYPHDEAAAYFEKGGLLAMIPMPGAQRYRLVFQLPRCRGKFAEQGMVHGTVSGKEIPDPTFEETREVVERAAGPGIRVSDPRWLAHFHIHSRLVQSFRRGRIFLAGDAAHIHSPAGGQGMNTGIQDAFNLAWKLALVHRQEASAQLLDTYSLERRSVAKSLLRATEFATHLASLKNPCSIFLRNWAISRLARIGVFRKRLVRTISQTAIRYPESSIAIRSRHSGPKSGTRMPNVLLIGDSGSIDLEEVLKKQVLHSLLIFTGPRPIHEEMEKRVRFARSLTVPTEPILIAQSPESLVLEGVRCFRDPNGAAHDKFGASKETLYLIRPDLVIGWSGGAAEVPRYSF